METRGALSILFIVVVALFSGCVASEADPESVPSGPPVAGGPASFDETSGGVEGFVLDGESQPVAGAIVALIEATLQVTTDEAGHFSFSNVPPAAYTLAVQKLGFTSVAKRIEVAAGKSAEATLVVERIELHDVYHTTFLFEGYFECSWTAGNTGPCFFPIVGTNNSYVPVDPWANNKRQFDYPVDAGVMTLLNEMTWDKTTAATGEWMSTFLSYQARTTSHWYCRNEGPNPVVIRWDRAADSEDPDDEGECNGTVQLPDDEPAAIPIEGQVLTTRANTGPGNVPGTDQDIVAGIAFQQSFDMYISAFYWEHAPADFTGMSDA